jgi:hypothetical protein
VLTDFGDVFVPRALDVGPPRRELAPRPRQGTRTPVRTRDLLASRLGQVGAGVAIMISATRL